MAGSGHGAFAALPAAVDSRGQPWTGSSWKPCSRCLGLARVRLLAPLAILRMVYVFLIFLCERSPSCWLTAQICNGWCWARLTSGAGSSVRAATRCHHPLAPGHQQDAGWAADGGPGPRHSALGCGWPSAGQPAVPHGCPRRVLSVPSWLAHGQCVQVLLVCVWTPRPAALLGLSLGPNGFVWNIEAE